MEKDRAAPVRWAKVVDQTKCIGCHACTVACKSENEVPLSVTRTFVKSVDAGVFPNTRRAFQVTRCNQCDDAPCVAACPTSAMFRRPDGIVDFDKSSCIGCKACIAACPYDAIFINPEDHAAEKCNFCAHRLDIGLEPACVVVCPTEALLVGDLDDADSRVSQIVGREAVQVRRPEKGTLPKLFYVGASGVTLDPLAAANPGGGLYMWGEQGSGSAHHVPSGHPAPPPERVGNDGDPDHAGRRGTPLPAGVTPGGNAAGSSSAAAIISYDVPHRAPWDFRVSAYTFTKSLAAGAYLVPLLLVLFGMLDGASRLWLVTTPVLALLFLLVTAGILIWDLDRPSRFWLLLVRPQWRSWLVRGGFILAGYGSLLALHLGLGLSDRADAAGSLAWLGGPLAVAAAVYTAYLFAQAKARDLWQSPLLPPHLLVQAVLAGAALLLVLPEVSGALGGGSSFGGAGIGAVWIFQVAVASHLLLALGEATMPHPTTHARLAAREMLRGRFAGPYWAGFALAGAGLVAVTVSQGVGLAGVLGAAGTLLGLLFFEHAYVQAGQSVPLA